MSNLQVYVPASLLDRNIDHLPPPLALALALPCCDHVPPVHRPRETRQQPGCDLQHREPAEVL
jgi:hypothetical protein